MRLSVGPRLGTAAAVLITVAIAASCVGESNSDQRDASGGLWAHRAGSLDASPAGQAVLPPKDPSGLTTAVVDRRSYYRNEDWVAVYADVPARRTLILILVSGSDTGPYVGDRRPLALGESPSHPAVRLFGGRWWMWWTPFSDGEEEAQVSMGAEGLTRQEALDVARDVVVDRVHRRVKLGHLRYGLRPLTVGRLSLPALPALCAPGGAWTGARVGWDRWRAVRSTRGVTRHRRSAAVCLSAWKASSGLDVLLQATVSGRRGIRVRGKPGASGTFAVPVFGAGDEPVEMRTWREGGATMLVTSIGVRDAAVDSFIASMRPAHEADWRRLAREAGRAHLEARDAHQVSLGGSFEGGTWSLTVAARMVRGELRIVVGRHLREHLTGQRSFGAATAANGLRIGVTAGTRGSLVWGVTDSGIARVVLTLADGSHISPLLIDGATFGAKVFALWRPDRQSVVSADAFDTHGHRRWHGEPTPAPPASLAPMTDHGFIGQPG